MQDIKPLPEPEIDNWRTATLDELRTELQNLRHWCGQLFLQVKEWTTRSNDLQQTAEQRIKLDSDEGAKYIDVSNKTAFLIREMDIARNTINNLTLQIPTINKQLADINDDITLIMDFLGMSPEESKEGEQSE